FDLFTVRVPPLCGSSKFLESDPAVLHLSTVGLEADWPRGGDFKRVLQNLSVAFAMSDGAFYRYHNFVPILGLILLEFLVRAGYEVIAALKLRFANENAAVSVYSGAELELQHKII